MSKDEKIERLEDAVLELIKLVLDMNSDNTWQSAFDKVKEIKRDLELGL